MLRPTLYCAPTEGRGSSTEYEMEHLNAMFGNQRRQPIILAVDTSITMNTQIQGQDKTNLELAEDITNNLVNDDSISDSIKRITDIAILEFSDDVKVHTDFIPLNLYKGCIRLGIGGWTCLYKTVITTIEMACKMVERYEAQGISSLHPHVYIITDGKGEDIENKAEAKRLCQQYVDSGQIKMDFLYLPGAEDDATSLSDKIRCYFTRDGKTGLPAISRYITNSIVVMGSADVGQKVAIALPDHLATAKANVCFDEKGNKVIAEEVTGNDTFFYHDGTMFKAAIPDDISCSDDVIY